MPNGKVLAGIIGGVALAAIVAAGSAVRQTWANEVTINKNAETCAEHRRDTKDMPKQVAKIEAHVEAIVKSQDKMDKKLDRILEANGK